MDRNRKAPEYVNASLRRFGLNPWGEPLYRVVWAETRCKTVGGEFHDGDRVIREYRYVPMYRTIQRWVLEVWLPTPVSLAQWMRDEFDPISGLLRSGPYPYRGEYWGNIFIQQADGGYLELSPGLCQFFASLIDKSRAVSAWDSFLANREEEARKKRVEMQRMRDIISDRISAFGPAAYSGAHGKSKEKTKQYLGPALRLPNFGQLQPHLINPKKLIH